MSESEKKAAAKKYRLYLALPDAIRKDEKHYLLTPDYCLVYTDRPIKGGGAEEIRDFSLLPSDAWEWLIGCINLIRAQYLARHREEVLKEAEKFSADFFAALKEQKAAAGETEVED